MTFTLTITADAPEELAAAIKGTAAQYQPSAHNSTPAVAPANTAPQNAPSLPGMPAPTTIQTPPVGQAAPATPQPPVVTHAVPLTTAPTYTIDQIAKAGAELAQSGKINDLLVLLQQFGIQAVTQLRPEQIGQFATSLRGLGAQL